MKNKTEILQASVVGPLLSRLYINETDESCIGTQTQYIGFTHDESSQTFKNPNDLWGYHMAACSGYVGEGRSWAVSRSLPRGKLEDAGRTWRPQTYSGNVQMMKIKYTLEHANKKGVQQHIA